MIRTLFPALAALALAAPAAAQPPTNEKVLQIFGTDKCPAGTVCVRAPESERYRIPKTIRDSQPVSVPNTQRDLAASTAAVSASGIGSCSAIGAGGWTGCSAQQWRTERAAAKAEADAAPSAQAPQ